MDIKYSPRLLNGLLAVLILFVAAKFAAELKELKFIGRDVPAVSTLTVNAEGEALAKPDIGQVTISVVRQADSAVLAQRQSAEAINKVVAFLKGAGIDDKDIKTVGYNLYPRYDYIQGRGQVPRGYELHQSLEVKIKNLDKAGEIIAGAAEAGANEVSGLGLTLDDPDKAKGQARAEAIAKAKTKARDLAQDLGIQLGRLVNFSESGNQPPIISEALGGDRGGFVAPAPQIPTGENRIVVQVSLTYEIK